MAAPLPRSIFKNLVKTEVLPGLTYDGIAGKEGSRGSIYVARVAAPGDER